MELNKIYNEDCLNGMKGLPDDSVDVIFTSPPYADRRKSTYGGVHESKYIEWFVPIAEEMKRILKPTGSIFINIKPHCSDGERVLYVYELVIALQKDVGLRFVDEFTWTKNGVPGRFNGRFKNAFEPVFHFTKKKGFKHRPYEVAAEMAEDSIKRAKRKRSGESLNGSGFAGLREGSTLHTKKLALPSNHLHIPQKSNQYTSQSKHPAVFPVELPTFFIKAFSDEGDVVLDPFMGSGTTAIASLRSGRSFIGFETVVEYCELASERLEYEKSLEQIKNHTTQTDIFNLLEGE